MVIVLSLPKRLLDLIFRRSMEQPRPYPHRLAILQIVRIERARSRRFARRKGFEGDGAPALPV